MSAQLDRDRWRRQAACAGAPTQLFFPPAPDTPAPMNPWSAEPAQALCAVCTVRQDCRDWAVATRQPDGVWGGLEPAELRRLWRRPRSSSARAS